jgi:hypothetical protein
MRIQPLAFFLGLALTACVVDEKGDDPSTDDTASTTDDTSSSDDTSSGDDGDDASDGSDTSSGGDTSGGGEDTSSTDTGSSDTGTVSPPESETDCADGIDEDEDGFTDCEDDDCAEDAACVETDCSDGVDNDGDGAMDCEDDDCADDAACAVETDCGHGVDNDGDGSIDCDDTDCEGAAECAVCEDEDLGTATGDAVASGVNTGMGDDSSGSCIYGTLAEDVAFLWEAPEDNCYVIDTEDSDYDTALYVWSDCGATEVDCDDDGGEGTTSMVEFCASAGDQYIIVVDGYTSTSLGTYSLDINVSPESVCDDGVDNDGDGLTDCEDDDCAEDAVCIESDCADGVDNDGDGAMDCDDSDCLAYSACYEAICDDASDDDGDGDVDCDDSDCALNLSCTSPTECPALELGDSTGDRLAFGNNAGWMDDESGSCGSTGGEDVMVSWEAPADGCYTFETSSSDYDTVLRQMDACGGTELACDDDGGDGTTSSLEVTAVAGDTIYISIDGYSSSSAGSFVLDVSEGCSSVP